MATFYGYLHTWWKGQDATADYSLLQSDKLIELLDIRSDFSQYSGKSLPGFRGWETYQYISPKPLMGEELDLIEGPYPYPFYLYRNPITGSVLVGSWRYNITNKIVEMLNFSLKLNLVRYSIDVQKVTKCILEQKEKMYFVTNLKLDINIYESRLESIMLSGTDVLGSGFLNMLKEGDYTGRLIGLRGADSHAESARLLNGGGIQFYSDRIRSLEVCLGFVSDIGALYTNV